MTQHFTFPFTLVQAQKHSSLKVDLDVLKLLDPTQEIDPEMCAQDLVDFSPVYRCLHIHSVLVCLPASA